MKNLLISLILLGVVLAAPLTIPPDQPLCKMYDLFKIIATIVGIGGIVYGGFIFQTSHEIHDRQKAKMIIAGALIGLAIVWIAPTLISYLSGSSVCGWA